MVTDPGDRVVESYVETDNSVETRKAVSDGLLGIHNVTSNTFWQFAAFFWDSVSTWCCRVCDEVELGV